MTTTLGLLGLLGLAFPSPALAQDDPDAGWVDESQDRRLRSELLAYAVDFGFHVGDVDFYSPSFQFRYNPSDWLSLEARWGFASSDGEVGVGSPMLTAFYVHRLEPGASIGGDLSQLGRSSGRRGSVHARNQDWIRVGLGLVAPVAENEALGGTMLRGLQDAWMWLPDYFSVVVPFQWQTRGEYIRGRLDTAVALMINTLSRGDPIEFAWQAGFELSGHLARDMFFIGARIDFFHLVTESLPTLADTLQVSAEPFLGVLLYDHFLRVGLRMNLDEPLGPPFDPNSPFAPSWGVMISLGGFVPR